MRLAAERCHPGEGRDRRWVEYRCESIVDDPGLRRGDNKCGWPPRDVIAAKAGIAGGLNTGANPPPTTPACAGVTRCARPAPG